MSGTTLVKQEINNGYILSSLTILIQKKICQDRSWVDNI